MDAIQFKVRKDNSVVSKAAYAAIGVNLEEQICIIHQIRNSSKYLSYKDLKAFNADLKLAYTAATEEITIAELDRLEQK